MSSTCRSGGKLRGGQRSKPKAETTRTAAKTTSAHTSIPFMRRRGDGSERSPGESASSEGNMPRQTES